MSPDVPHTGKHVVHSLVWDHFALIQHLPDEKLVSNDISNEPGVPVTYNHSDQHLYVNNGK